MRVTDSIMYKGKQIGTFLEHADENDIRENEPFDQSSSIFLDKESGSMLRLCKSRDEKIFEKHRTPLFQENGETVYFSSKGTRPIYRELTEIFDKPGEYVLKYSENGTTSVQYAGKTIKTIDKKVFYILATGAGGGGGRGVSQYVMFFATSVACGCGGGSGASAMMVVDMSVAKTVRIAVGKGGKGSSSSSSQDIDGFPTVISCEDGRLVLGGGKGAIGYSPLHSQGAEGGMCSILNIHRQSFEKNSIYILEEFGGKRGGGSNTFYKIDNKFAVKGEDFKETITPKFSEGNPLREDRTLKINIISRADRAYTTPDEISASGAASIFHSGGLGARVEYNEMLNSSHTAGALGSGGGGGTFQKEPSFIFAGKVLKKGGNGGDGAFRILY